MAPLPPLLRPCSDPGPMLTGAASWRGGAGARPARAGRCPLACRRTANPQGSTGSAASQGEGASVSVGGGRGGGNSLQSCSHSHRMHCVATEHYTGLRPTSWSGISSHRLPTSPSSTSCRKYRSAPTACKPAMSRANLRTGSRAAASYSPRILWCTCSRAVRLEAASSLAFPCVTVQHFWEVHASTLLPFQLLPGLNRMVRQSARMLYVTIFSAFPGRRGSSGLEEEQGAKPRAYQGPGSCGEAPGLEQGRSQYSYTSTCRRGMGYLPLNTTAHSMQLRYLAMHSSLSKVVSMTGPVPE